MKLYRVTCQGMQGSHGFAYVIDDDAQSAYDQLKKYLDDKDIGLYQSRVLSKIELVAEEGQFPSCGIKLLIKEG